MSNLKIPLTQTRNSQIIGQLNDKVLTMKRFFIYSAIFCSILTVSACQNNDVHHVTSKSINKELITPEIATGWSEKPVVTSKKFMVVAAHPLASRAGQKILARGGSAIDAAIAVQAVLNVVEPQSSGIGGGGFLLHYNAKKNKMRAYDGRETAPSGVTSDLFLKQDGTPQDFTYAASGGGAVAVPGLLKMLWQAHQAQGKLPWKVLFNDAIDYAENGFKLTPRLQKMLSSALHYKELSETDFKRYLDQDGQVKEINNVIYNKPLAKTFQVIADQGIKSFYSGTIAQDIIKTVTETEHFPSKMVLSDLKNYEPITRDPVCILYHAYKLCGMGPPSSGGVTVLQALKMLERFNLQDYDYYDSQDVHLTASALRLAYADRNKYLADPEFIAVPTYSLLSETYLRERSELIYPDKALDIIGAGDPSQPITQFASLKTSEPPSTTHISIVDQYGNAVSFTSTVERAFGSGLVTKSGFILNNQMTDFDFIPNKNGVLVANRVEANKRPRSSMAPFIIFNPKGELMGVIGSPGGARIISYVFPRILSMIHSKQPINKMLSAPNMTAMHKTPDIELEQGMNLHNLDNDLVKYGYIPVIRDLTSGIHIIYKKEGTFYGAADPRREGIALGEGN